MRQELVSATRNPQFHCTILHRIVGYHMMLCYAILFDIHRNCYALAQPDTLITVSTENAKNLALSAMWCPAAIQK